MAQDRDLEKRIVRGAGMLYGLGLAALKSVEYAVAEEDDLEKSAPRIASVSYKTLSSSGGVQINILNKFNSSEWTIEKDGVRETVTRDAGSPTTFYNTFPIGGRAVKAVLKNDYGSTSMYFGPYIPNLDKRKYAVSMLVDKNILDVKFYTYPGIDLFLVVDGLRHMLDYAIEVFHSTYMEPSMEYRNSKFDLSIVAGKQVYLEVREVGPLVQIPLKV